MTKINDHAYYPRMYKHPNWTGLTENRTSLLTVWLSPKVGIYPSWFYNQWRQACYSEHCNGFDEVPCSHEEMLKVLAYQLPRTPDPDQLVSPELHQLVQEYYDSVK